MKTPGVDVALYVCGPIVMVLPATQLLPSGKADMSNVVVVGGFPAVDGGINVRESPDASQPSLTELPPISPSLLRTFRVPSPVT